MSQARVIYVGIDDTDTLDSPGTNQLAKRLVAGVADICRPVFILRHQLWDSPRVPCTSQNGSASIWLEPRSLPVDLDALFDRLRAMMLEAFVPGSDPGLAIASSIPEPVREFGRRCQREWIERDDAWRLAESLGIRLEGLGGTEGGVIGALAALGLAATRDDGRVVQQGEWPDERGGRRSCAELGAWGVEVREHRSGQPIQDGWIEVGKKLRPNLRGGQVVLFVERADAGDESAWRALKVK